MHISAENGYYRIYTPPATPEDGFGVKLQPYVLSMHDIIGSILSTDYSKAINRAIVQLMA